jgi:hypothetical protein
MPELREEDLGHPAASALCVHPAISQTHVAHAASLKRRSRNI